MSASKDKSEPVPEPTIMPNLVTRVVGPQGEALNAIVMAMEMELSQGRQFYAMPVDQVWGVFYNGPVAIH